MAEKPRFTEEAPMGDGVWSMFITPARRRRELAKASERMASLSSGTMEWEEGELTRWYVPFILVFRAGTAILPCVPRVIPRAVPSGSRLEFPKCPKSEEESPAPAAPVPHSLMSSVKATQLRPGMVIQHGRDLFTVFTTEHRTPGNKRGSMQTRMKNRRTGAIIEYRFRAEEFVDRAILDEIEFEYLYKEGDDFHFMNTKTYEQMQMTKDELGETVNYLIPNTIVKIEFHDDKAI